MTFIEGEIIIARPAAAVFDFAADQRNEPRYNPRMVRAEKVTGGPVGLGTVFRSAVRAMGQPAEMRSELTGYRRPAWLASRTTMAQADIAGTLNFEPVPAGRGCAGRGSSGRGGEPTAHSLISQLGQRHRAGDLDWHEAMPGSTAAAGEGRQAPAPAPAGTGWTVGRIIALAAGSVLLLVSLAFIAGGAILVWADAGQVHSGYVTTSTATYSTQGSLGRDSVNVRGLSPFIDKIRSGSPRPTRPPAVAASPPPALSGATWATSATRRSTDTTSPTIRAPGSRRLRPPRCPRPRGCRGPGP